MSGERKRGFIRPVQMMRRLHLNVGAAGLRCGK